MVIKTTKRRTYSMVKECEAQWWQHRADSYSCENTGMVSTKPDLKLMSEPQETWLNYTGSVRKTSFHTKVLESLNDFSDSSVWKYLASTIGTNWIYLPSGHIKPAIFYWTSCHKNYMFNLSKEWSFQSLCYFTGSAKRPKRPQKQEITEQSIEFISGLWSVLLFQKSMWFLSPHISHNSHVLCR